MTELVFFEDIGPWIKHSQGADISINCNPWPSSKSLAVVMNNCNYFNMSSILCSSVSAHVLWHPMHPGKKIPVCLGCTGGGGCHLLEQPLSTLISPVMVELVRNILILKKPSWIGRLRNAKKWKWFPDDNSKCLRVINLEPGPQTNLRSGKTPIGVAILIFKVNDSQVFCGASILTKCIYSVFAISWWLDFS